LVFVVPFWCHDVTWKSGCFSAPERGDFPKNYGIFQLIKLGPFWGHLLWFSANQPLGWGIILDGKVDN